MPLVAATRAKQDPNLLSSSRMRYFGVCPKGVASRSCCVVQASVGDRVTPTWMTFREWSSMMKNTKSERKNTSLTWRRITGPDFFVMIAYEGAPALSSPSRFADMPHILLNGSFTQPNTQLEQLATDPLRSPEPILRRHLLDQNDGLCGYFRFMRVGLGSALPIQAKAFTMPRQKCFWLNNDERLFPCPDHPCQ
jgi:hypothetical protein